MPTEPLPPVTLVVLAWNHWDLTRRCLESLLASDLTGAEVVVVDNGSTDETPGALSSFQDVRVLRLPRNLGFVGGNNAGIEASSPGSDIVLLNNDLEFPQRDWLQRLRRSAHAAPDIGVTGCRLVRPDGELLHAGAYILPDTCWGQQLGSQETDIGQYADRDREVGSVVFACAYLKRSAIESVGLLSTDFESYFEDTDYCLRARENGFRVLVCGGVTLVHHEHGSTADAPEAFDQLYQRSRATFRRKWQRKLEARYRHRVLWQSIMNFPTGYAASCREILRNLDDLGVWVAYRYVYGRGTGFPLEEPENSRDYRLNVLRERDLQHPPPTSVVYGQGDVFHRSRGKYGIGYTMLEVDGFPDEWVRQANRLDEIWVPSEFNLQGFVDSGLRRPIHKMPLGIDPAYFHPAIETVRNPHGELVFLSVFEWGERKDPWLLLQTFNDVFAASEPVRLVCKVINRDPSVDLKEEIRRLRLRESGGRISYLFNVEFPHYQLGALYRSADCYVTVGRGEGWDMPLMEAMACGLPCIATDWGAHREFFHPGVGYPLAVRRLVPAVAKCPYYAGFRWAEPDAEHLRHLLRTVYEDRAGAARLGAAAAAEVAERWTWRHAAAKIAARLEQVGGAGLRAAAGSAQAG
jgi:GT2 family glycosyltransferase